MNNLSLDEKLYAIANNKHLQYYAKNLKQWFDIDEQPCGDEIEILSYNITLKD